MRKLRCDSCGVPIATGPYCRDCVDATGKLQSFEQRFERMLLSWQRLTLSGDTREQLVRRTLAYMATMPAWKDHPRIKAEFPEM